MSGNEGVALEYTRNRVKLYADSLEEMSKICRRDRISKRRTEEGETNEESSSAEWDRERRNEEKQLLGDYLEDLSEHMHQMMGQAFLLNHYSGKEERRIKAAFLREGILVKEIMIFHRGEETLVGMKVGCKRIGGCEKEGLAKFLSTLLKKEMVAADYTDHYIRREIVTQVFWERPRYFCTYGVAKAVKTGEQVSGDNFSVLEKENGFLIGMLSDGMGCGELAYEDSCEVLDYVEKLLEMGFSPAQAIENSRRLFLLQGDNQSTLDLCVVNLHKGSGCFYKVGGGASFLKSGNYVETVSCPGLPLGIWTAEKKLTCEAFGKERELVNGDYIFMMTDGVIDAWEKEGYEKGICAILEKEKERHPQEMADRLLQISLAGCGEHIRDDMTVLVFRIWDSFRE